ncbi:transposable element Tcb2 transposase [Trichonephila clavipes]|nr:transposable element Tcb2 transposase [Trichonephila clavipes]
MSTMSQRSHLTDSDAWRVVGRLERGQTQAEVAQAIGVSQRVISRIWNRFLETGSAGRRPGQGRRRATTPNEDRYLVLTARRHRNMNATLLQQHLGSATGTTVSTQTVRNRLHGVGLYARRPMSCFSVHPDNRRIFIGRDRGSRNNPAFVHESVRFGGGRVLVYGGTYIDGRTDLYIIRDGPLTARRYRDEILRHILVPDAAAIGYDFILMDDNCRPHRANLNFIKNTSSKASKQTYLSIRPYLLTNRTTQKLSEGTKSSGMIRGIRLDNLYSDIPIR